MRVPTPNVSLIELVFCTKKNLSVEKINSVLDELNQETDILINEIDKWQM